jgi:hypothetical protein
MCFDDHRVANEDDNRPSTDPAAVSSAIDYCGLLAKLKPSIALAAGRKAAREYNRKWYLRNRNKKMSYSVYRRALERGDLIRPAQCEKCGGDQGGIEGHHCDYDKPLDVMWLCRLCHKKWHRDNGKALNG